METKEEIKERILKWYTNEYHNLDDDFYKYFEKCGYWDWIPISKEVRILSNELFNEDIEENSPKDLMICAALAQAANGVVEAMAAALGLDAKILHITLSPWYELQDNKPPSLSFEDFMAWYELDKKEFKN